MSNPSHLPGFLIPAILALPLAAADARSELLKVPPVHIALPHPELLANRAKPRIAFLAPNGNATTKNLIDQAIAHLTRKGFDVLDRENLERILREQKIHGSELIDLDQQVQLGKIMGVTDLVIVEGGTLGGGACRVSMKAIDITSARVLRLVKDVYGDAKNAAKALAGFYLEWNETYDLRFAACPALEGGEYESLTDTYQLVLGATQSAAKIDTLAQVISSRDSGSRHNYKAAGSHLFTIKAWKNEPEDSPKRGAYLVFEAYLESQLGLLYLRQDKLDAAWSHLEQAELKFDKSNADAPDADQLARDIKFAKAIVQRLKTERETAEE